MLVAEVKYLYQPIKISSADNMLKVTSVWYFVAIKSCSFLLCASNSSIIITQIENGHFFETTDALDFSWVLQGDGCILGSGSLNVPTLAPQTSHLINMESSPWFSLWTTYAAKEVFLSVNVKQRYQTQWAKDGHLLASAQLCLPQKNGFVPHVCFLSLIYYSTTIFFSALSYSLIPSTGNSILQ